MDDNQSLTLLGENQQQDVLPAAITDTGCERKVNEDRYAYIETPYGELWLVCDGMGGVSGGELAAQLAIDAIRREVDQSLEEGGATSDILLKTAIEEANRVIVLRRQNKMFAQMGTTIVGALFNGDQISIAHVGDSRAYLVRNRKIEQLTNDHTFVQELVDNGKITIEEALNHPQSHVLTRAIGSEAKVDVAVQDLWIWDAPAGENFDKLVLCSDGLYSHVSDDELCKAVAEKSPQRACADLVELAKSRGGFDNITVCIIPILGQLKRARPEEQQVSKLNKLFSLSNTERTYWGIFLGEFLISILISITLMIVVFFIVGVQIISS